MQSRNPVQMLLSSLEDADAGGFRDRGARNSVRMIGKVGAPCVRDSPKNSSLRPFNLLFCDRRPVTVAYLIFV